MLLEKDEEISRNDRVRNEVVLRRLKARWVILCTINETKADWIGHLLFRNCPLTQVIEEEMEGEEEVEDVCSC